MNNLILLKEFINLKLAAIFDALKVKSPLLYVVLVLAAVAVLVPVVQWAASCTEWYCQAASYLGVALLGFFGTKTTDILNEVKTKE
jgi:hypothetical protein